MHSDLVIVCGAPRSGTSILQRILNSHPKMHVFHELRIFHQLGTSYSVYINSLLKRLSNEKKDNRRLDVYHYLLNLLLTGMRHQNLHYPDVHIALERTFPKMQLIGDKYPGYWRRLDEYTSWSRAHVIFIYRDCRDVVSSTLQMAQTTWRDKEWAAKLRNNPEKIADRWVACMLKMQALQANMTIVRYEDLVKEPDNVLRTVSFHLGLDPAGFDLQTIRGTSIGKYKNYLSSQQIDKIVQIAGPIMRDFSYV